MLLLLLVGGLMSACDKDDNTPADRTDDVVEIAIRQVKTGQLTAFEQARTNFIVGMTVYESQQAFFNIAANPAFANHPDVVAFFTSYPPNLGGEVSTVVK